MQINILFVWRGSIEKYSLRLDEKIETLIFDFNNDFNTNYESFLEICAYLSSLILNLRKEEDIESQKNKNILKNLWNI